MSEWFDAVVPDCHGSGETDMQAVQGHGNEVGGAGPRVVGAGPRAEDSLEGLVECGETVA